MIDFHTHILQRTDDGSASLDEALLVLNKWQSIGFDDVLLTPHYVAYQISLENFLNRRDSEFEKLSDKYKGGISLHKACEVYLCDALFNNSGIEELTINGKHILVELPVEEKLSSKSVLLIKKLINNYNYIPVIAHIERYHYLFIPQNKQLLKEMGVLFQISFGFYKNILYRKRMLQLIDENMVYALGTDVHGTRRDFKNIENVIKKCGRIIGTDRAERIYNNSKELLKEKI